MWWERHRLTPLGPQPSGKHRALRMPDTLQGLLARKVLDHFERKFAMRWLSKPDMEHHRVGPFAVSNLGYQLVLSAWQPGASRQRR